MFTENNVTVCSKEEIKALLAHASKDFTRQNLCCVLFDDHAAVSTDGHRLAALRAEGFRGSLKTGGAGTGTAVQIDALESAARACKKGQKIRITRGAEHAATIEVIVDGPQTVLATFSSKLDADVRFPPYQQVIPDDVSSSFEPRPTGFGVNAEHLADLVLVQKACGSGRRSCVNFYPGTDILAPMVAKVEDWLVVIMPARADTNAESPAAKEAAGIWTSLVAFFNSSRDHKSSRSAVCSFLASQVTRVIDTTGKAA